MTHEDLRRGLSMASGAKLAVKTAIGCLFHFSSFLNANTAFGQAIRRRAGHIQPLRVGSVAALKARKGTWKRSFGLRLKFRLVPPQIYENYKQDSCGDNSSGYRCRALQLMNAAT